MPAEFWWRKLKNKNSKEDPGMFAAIMLNGFFKGVRWEVVDWIHLVQDMYKSGKE
jgi:hypothetical protein